MTMHSRSVLLLSVAQVTAKQGAIHEDLDNMGSPG